MSDSRSFTVAIASGKGGTGKTTLATNLAAWAAERTSVVLVDLDVEEPNAGLFIKGEQVKREELFKMIPQWEAEKCTLCGICQNSCNFHAVLQLGAAIVVFPELCHSCHACSELCPAQALPMQPRRMGEWALFKAQQLTFIEGRLDMGEEQAVPVIKQTKQKLSAEAGQAKLIILDAPPGTSCPMIESVKDADYVILVTEPTPFGLHDVQLAVEVVRKLGKPFGLVINRAGSGDDRIYDFCQKEAVEILASIPTQREIARLYSAGELIYPQVPEFAGALNDIWLHLRNYYPVEV